MSFIREHIVKPYQSFAPKALGGKRSRKWPKTARAHKKAHPTCAVCGRRKKIQTHHKKDYSHHPELELDWGNLMSLCMGATRCHFLFGHLGNWKSINISIEHDALEWHDRIEFRP